MNRQAAALATAGLGAALLTGAALTRPRFSANAEAEAYPWEGPYLKPHSVVDGLAVYAVGSGPPVLLFPYPHAHTTAPMAQSRLAARLLEAGHRVISFDVPGAYRSTRTPRLDMAEMLDCAEEALDRLGLHAPVDVVGHSMGSLAALGFAVERGERVRRLVLVGSMSSFAAAIRHGLPSSALAPTEPDYWRLVTWGLRLSFGLGDLALHKRLQNLMGRLSVHQPSHFTPLPILDGDAERGVPVRMRWSRLGFSGLSYANRLAAVRVPTLIIAGRHDPQTPLACAQELQRGIGGAKLAVFEHSGHAPFVEEPEPFTQRLRTFLRAELAAPSQAGIRLGP